jgi:hypothetical protein
MSNLFKITENKNYLKISQNTCIKGQKSTNGKEAACARFISLVMLLYVQCIFDIIENKIKKK